MRQNTDQNNSEYGYFARSDDYILIVIKKTKCKKVIVWSFAILNGVKNNFFRRLLEKMKYMNDSGWIFFMKTIATLQSLAF